MSELTPKPMIQIGGKPMLWHIMKLYAHYGYNEFVLALGYKQDVIKEYFSHFDTINYDCLINTGWKGPYGNSLDLPDRWSVMLSDTGEDTLKGARLKRIEKYLQGDTFAMTYGDGIGDINIPKLIDFHKKHGKMVTITGVHPEPRFGELLHDEKGRVISYREKPHDGCLINGGFMVMNRAIFGYLSEDKWCDLEAGPLEVIAAKGELMVYHHEGWWGCMDTLRDMEILRDMWNKGTAKWRVW